MKKRNIVFLVFMLVVGFAAIATTLVINGNINLSFNESEFTSNVVFTEAKTPDGTATISSNEQNINFETKILSRINETSILDYEVTNKSRQYNASVTINCGLKDSFQSYNEYFEITNDLVSPFELESAESKTGKLTIKLKKAYTESDTTIGLSCILTASPVSRNTVGNKYIVPYKDSILNGTDPILDDNKQLVPIKLANDGTVTYADIESEWYNYANKEWANAVILVDSPSKIYQVNDTILESDIESYFVWIPRYRYQIFNKGEYTTTQAKLSSSIAKEIKIEFEGKERDASTGSEVGEWLTHPAFSNDNTNGIWVGKFETGYNGATSTANAQQNVNDSSKVIVKPNVYSWRNITVSNIFKTAASYAENLNSHMMSNTEWGAVAYLSHSKYGINNEIRINNHSNYLTGYAANTKDASGSTTNNSKYNTETGYLASTTGNITGVYDMSGGAWEYVAGYRANTPGNSGLTIEELTTYANYLNVYNAGSSKMSYNCRILGDATGEMGPFYTNTGALLNNWYNDYSFFIESSYPWFVRGSYYADASYAGQFNFSTYTGGTRDRNGFRITLAF